MLETLAPTRIPLGLLGNLAATALRLGFLILVGREVATRLGSEGIVVMGQLQNLLALGLALPAMALQPAIQQVVGSAAPEQVPPRSSWALLAGQILALVAGVVVLWSATSGIVYLPRQVHDVVWVFLPGLLALSLVHNLQAIATGKRDLKRVNLFIALSGLLQALWLYGWIHQGLQGLVPGVLLFGAVAIPFAFWLLKPFPLSRPRLDQWKEQFRLWAPLATMGAVSAILTPYLQINVRETVLALGVEVTGNWQGAVRITDLLYGTWYGAFMAWSLPRLSGPPEQRPGFARLALCPLGALAMGLVLVVGGSLVLDIAYVGRFPEALPVLRLQCLAELVRACGLPLAMILIARRRTVAFIALELGSSLLQVVLVRLFVPRFGSNGAPLAIALEATIYLVFAGWVVSRREDLPLAA
jgi:O-antigen/teichoic acid export membrane protein